MYIPRYFEIRYTLRKTTFVSGQLYSKSEYHLFIQLLFNTTFLLISFITFTVRTEYVLQNKYDKTH